MLRQETNQRLHPGHLIYISDQTLEDYGYLQGEDPKKFIKITEIFESQPSIDDIRQTMGNCYFLAVLSALVSRNPEIIKQMMYEEDKFFYVNLYVCVDEGYQLVTYQLDKTKCVNEKELQEGHKKDWVFLLEKAYSVHRIMMNDPCSYKTGLEEIISGGLSEDAFQALLGIPVEVFIFAEMNSHSRDEKQELYTILSNALKNEGLVCADICGNKKILRGVENNHIYTIYDLYQREGRAYIKMSNPYGYNQDLYSDNSHKYAFIRFFKKLGYQEELNQHEFVGGFLNNEEKSRINAYPGCLEITFDDFIDAFNGIVFTKITKNTLSCTKLYSISSNHI